MSNTSKKAISLLFLAIIFVVGLSVVRTATQEIVKSIFENEVSEETTLSENFTSTRDRVEEIYNNLPIKNASITLNGAVQRALGKDYVDDVDNSKDVVKLENGYLSFTLPKVDTTQYAENIIELNEYLQQQGIDFLYLQAPYKISKYDDQLPGGVSDYSNENADELLAQLEEAGVDYIDFRQEMYNQNINQYDMFFKTDHHWTPEAALWAFGVVGEYLNQNYGFEISEELYDPENFNYEVKEDWFLGSQGKRVGPLYAGVDDISIITPKFETSFTFEVPSRDIEKTGSFEEVMFDYSKIEEKDYYALNPYAAYTGGDYPVNTIENHNDEDGKEVILIRDSFSCVFSPFMALGCSELHVIDLRYFEEDLPEYIEEVDPDMVMVLYNPSSFNDQMFKFGL